MKIYIFTGALLEPTFKPELISIVDDMSVAPAFHREDGIKIPEDEDANPRRFKIIKRDWRFNAESPGLYITAQEIISDDEAEAIGERKKITT